MKFSSLLAYSLCLSFVALSAEAERPIRAKKITETRSILGPVTVGLDETLKICTTDVSVFAAPRPGRSEGRSVDRGVAVQSSWSSTGVAVYDSRDTSVPLSLDIPDVIFPRGEGGCFEVAGRDIGSAAGSIIVVLRTLATAQAGFEPITTGELRAPGDRAVALLVPIVQSAEDSAPAASCCACAPVCGCGICRD